MADFSGIRDELKVRLLTISGLRVYDVVPGSVNVPAAVVIPADPVVEFDEAMGRGLDTIRFTIVVYASKATDDRAQDKLDGYLAGSGAGSIKAALETDRTLAGKSDTLIVRRAHSYGWHTIGDIEYVGVVFDVEIHARG